MANAYQRHTISDKPVSIFEECKWNRTCHAFREWDGWSLEHEGTPTNMEHTGKSDRLDVMLKYFKQNKK